MYVFDARGSTQAFRHVFSYYTVNVITKNPTVERLAESLKENVQW